MTKRIIFLCAVMIVLIWQTFANVPQASAQDPNRLTVLNISVWPEYDRTTVLVMFDGILANASNLPREVAVLIPSSATFHVATYENADGSLAAEQPVQTSVLGDGYTRVTFTVPVANYHVEYYDDLLRGSPDKTINFVYKTASPVDTIKAEVQQPLNASNFALTPAAQSTRPDAQGFNYYSLQFPAQNVNQTITFQAKYTKSNPSPSISVQAPTSNLPVTTATSDSSQWTNLFLLGAMVVLGLTAVFGFLLLQKRSDRPVSAHNSTGKRARAKSARASGTPSQVSAYCTQCGHGLSTEDNFCPRCGTKRRIA